MLNLGTQAQVVNNEKSWMRSKIREEQKEQVLLSRTNPEWKNLREGAAMRSYCAERDACCWVFLKKIPRMAGVSHSLLHLAVLITTTPAHNFFPL